MTVALIILGVGGLGGVWAIASALNKVANGMAVLATIHLQMAKFADDPGELAHAAHKIEAALGLDSGVFAPTERDS